jgi:hypothetical protein
MNVWGLSSAERAEYNREIKRIDELEIEIAASAVREKMCNLPRQSREISRTKNPNRTLLMLRFVSPTVTGKRTRRTPLPLRGGRPKRKEGT